MCNTSKLVDEVSTQFPKCMQMKINHQKPQDLCDTTDLAQKKAEGSYGISDRYENRRPQNGHQVFTRKHGRSIGEEQMKLRGVCLIEQQVSARDLQRKPQRLEHSGSYELPKLTQQSTLYRKGPHTEGKLLELESKLNRLELTEEKGEKTVQTKCR